MTDPASTPIDVDFDDAFDAWIEGGAVAQRSVVIYGKPQLYAQFQDLERQMTNLTAAIGKDGTQGDSAMAELEGQYQALYDEWMAAKSTWYVHALSDDDKTLVRNGIPDFDRLPADATDADKAKRSREIEAAQVEANLRTVAVGTLRIDLAGTTLQLPPITKVIDGDDASKKQAMKDVDRIVHKLRAMVRKIGDEGVLKLLTAIAEAAETQVDLPAPKSRKRSESAQD